MRKIRNIAFAVSLAATATCIAGPSWATAAIDGSVFQQAVVNLGRTSDEVDTQQDHWIGTIRDLSAHVSESVSTAATSARAHSTVNAHWDSADGGSVEFTDHGWDDAFVTARTAELFALNRPETGLADWSYQFTASRDGMFMLDFSLAGDGNDLFALGRWDLVFEPQGGAIETIALHHDDNLNSPVSGQVERALLAGQTYRVALVSSEALSTSSIVGVDRVSHETANFNWSISSPAPEPSTWALFIAGFGLVGAAARSRRRPEAAN